MSFGGGIGAFHIGVDKIGVRQDLFTSWPGLMVLDISWGTQSSGQGSGQTIVKQLRDPLWTLHAESKILSPNQVMRWKAILNNLNNGSNLFYGGEMMRRYPINYPKGIGFTAGTPIIASIGSQAISISGLQANFLGACGDLFAVQWGSSPTSLALLQSAEDWQADGSGLSPSFLVNGAIPAGMTTGNTVVVESPTCHMRMVPGSLKIPNDHTGWGTISFDGLQVPAL